MEFQELHDLLRSDPERAWPSVLEYLRDFSETGEAIDLIEDLVYDRDDRFIDRLACAALADPAVRAVVEQAYIGGFATKGAEAFHRLQESLRGPAQ